MCQFCPLSMDHHFGTFTVEVTFQDLFRTSKHTFHNEIQMLIMCMSQRIENVLMQILINIVMTEP